MWEIDPHTTKKCKQTNVYQHVPRGNNYLSAAKRMELAVYYHTEKLILYQATCIDPIKHGALR